MRKPRADRSRRRKTPAPYFVTYLPIFLDYLAVEKGLAKNSLSAYASDLRHFGHWLLDQELELDRVERIHIVKYFQALRARRHLGAQRWRGRWRRSAGCSGSSSPSGT